MLATVAAVEDVILLAALEVVVISAAVEVLVVSAAAEGSSSRIPAEAEVVVVVSAAVEVVVVSVEVVPQNVTSYIETQSSCVLNVVMILR